MTYAFGILVDGERKSVEPIAGRAASDLSHIVQRDESSRIAERPNICRK